MVLLDVHHTTAGEDNLQTGETLVAGAQVAYPIGQFIDLVNEQYLSSVAVEFTRKLTETLTLEVKVVHVDVQALTVNDTEVLTRVLQKECGLTHTARSPDADQSVIPVDLIHKGPPDRSLSMLHEVGVCLEKGFHLLYLQLFTRQNY